MANQDPLGYYRALHVSPGASEQEIRLSYQFLKAAYRDEGKQLDVGTIRAAFQTLTDPDERARYDGGQIRAPRMQAVGGTLRAQSTPVLVTVLLIAVVACMIVFGPSLKANLTEFGPGDALVWSANGMPLGTVVSVDARHEFPGGAVAKAYEIRPDRGGAVKWMPASDVERHARTRSD